MQEIDQLSLTRPQLGTWPAPRHVPSPGIELVTFWFTGRHSVHQTTPARAYATSFKLSTTQQDAAFSTWFTDVIFAVT